MLTIQPVTLADIADLLPSAKREGLILLKGTDYYGALSDGRLIGFAGIKWDHRRRVACFKNNYVIPSARRAGVGMALLDYRIRVALAAGARTIRSNVLPPACGLYAKRGFRITTPAGNRFVSAAVFDVSKINELPKAHLA